MVASLLKQLLSALPEIPTEVNDVFNKVECGEWASDLITAFITFIKKFSAKFSCVAVLVDAFDECQRDEQTHIVNVITDLRKSGLKIYMTTRQECQNYLESKFDGAVSIKIAAQDSDIKLFLEKQITSEDIDDDLKDEIISTICPQAQGMYTSILQSPN